MGLEEMGSRASLNGLEVTWGWRAPFGKHTPAICRQLCVFFLCVCVEGKDIRGDTPLHLAAESNELEIVTELLKAGASPNSRSVPPYPIICPRVS